MLEAGPRTAATALSEILRQLIPLLSELGFTNFLNALTWKLILRLEGF